MVASWQTPPKPMETGRLKQQKTKTENLAIPSCERVSPKMPENPTPEAPPALSLLCERDLPDFGTL